MSHLVESLELVEEFALIGDQSLLFVELFAELGKLEVLMVLLVFKFGLKGTLFVFFDLNHAQFSLSTALLILLAAAVDRHDDEAHQDDAHDENNRYEHDCIIALSSVALVFAVGGIQNSQVHF